MPKDGWTIALVVVAGYVAVMGLVRLMVRRQKQLLDRFRAEMEAVKKQKAAEAEKAARGSRRKAA